MAGHRLAIIRADPYFRETRADDLALLNVGFLLRSDLAAPLRGIFNVLKIQAIVRPKPEFNIALVGEFGAGEGI
ncbi:hypothetical protein JNB88_11760 [Rhizobium cauense]|uniref:hypothetical protein n=1 Tax=Rhizobium cauense TaxID=1166683 RepID=UPI001C6E82EC|nr:hypothetical protein [Rhizobium cauense]MBW9114319.1 hypothetical protein [Rhizobium cauense]